MAVFNRLVYLRGGTIIDESWGFLIAVPDACYSTTEERCTFRLKYFVHDGAP